MLVVTDRYQIVISAPAIGVNHCFLGHLTQDDILQSLLLAVGNDLGEDFPVAFEDTEDRLLEGASASLEFALEAPFAPSSEVGLITLGLSDDLALLLDTMSVDRDANLQEIMIDGLAIHSDEQGRPRGVDVDTETSQNLFDDVGADFLLCKHASRLLTFQVMV